ncbi:hypothetical protein M422DRAFT_245328 [Sphaerobolus stellatus SS14]|nr:hypothetical protein M422DRAFT_245328 [Sphaerobolus stellatus SS14]
MRPDDDFRYGGPLSTPPQAPAWPRGTILHKGFYDLLSVIPTPSASVFWRAPNVNVEDPALLAGPPYHQLPNSNAHTPPRKPRMPISKDMVSKPTDFVHLVHASDADEAEILLRRWGPDGMGKLGDPRWADPIKKIVRQKAAQARAVAQVVTAMRDDLASRFRDPPLRVTNATLSSTVLEFMGGGDLLSLLIERVVFEEDFTRFYVAEMVLAIEQCDKHGFIHWDIKPDNFLFDPDGHIKLSDFGLATDLHWAHNTSYYDQQRKDLLRRHCIDLEDGSGFGDPKPYLPSGSATRKMNKGEVERIMGSGPEGAEGGGLNQLIDLMGLPNPTIHGSEDVGGWPVATFVPKRKPSLSTKRYEGHQEFRVSVDGVEGQRLFICRLVSNSRGITSVSSSSVPKFELLERSDHCVVTYRIHFMSPSHIGTDSIPHSHLQYIDNDGPRL